jgi:hypothetical protein
MVYGGKWVETVPKNKKFDLSFLYSAGIGLEDQFEGYRLRRKIFNERNKIKIPTSFFTSIKRPPIEVDFPIPFPFESKDMLFESMFSVVIENDFQINFFTEKIIDAVSTFTIPIYFGCPNIGEFFDVSGIIIPRSIEEFVFVVNNLTPMDYFEKMSVLVDNFHRSKKYWNPLNVLEDLIVQSFNGCYSEKLV